MTTTESFRGTVVDDVADFTRPADRVRSGGELVGLRRTQRVSAKASPADRPPGEAEEAGAGRCR
ncbi:hypothetical protein ACFWIJ_42370 [Streptomyces sp. NPDC127079]|uniref:hypothetical protein n=1 Tax=Streptomyces sp. NPDC127079 TaxID=3347132 RepID=UPI0036504061